MIFSQLTQCMSQSHLTAGQTLHHGRGKLTNDTGIFTFTIAVVYQITVFPDSQMIVSVNVSWCKIEGRAKIIVFIDIKDIPKTGIETFPQIGISGSISCKHWVGHNKPISKTGDQEGLIILLVHHGRY